jgi:hypothetical protein
VQDQAGGRREYCPGPQDRSLQQCESLAFANAWYNYEYSRWLREMQGGCPGRKLSCY